MPDPGAEGPFEVPPHAFVRVTGQLWKLAAGGVILPLPAVLLGLWALRRIRPEQPLGESIASIGALASLAVVIAIVLRSVRCPSCGSRLLGTVLRSPEGLGALTTLLTRPDCPSCGWRPDGRS